MAGFAFLPGYGLTALTPAPAPPPPSLCALPTPALCFFGYHLQPSLITFPSVPQQLQLPWRVVAACRT